MSRKPEYEQPASKPKPEKDPPFEYSCADGHLSQVEETCAGLVEASLTGIYIDQDGCIVFANRQFADIFGYPRSELIGMKSWALVHPDDRTLTNERRHKRLRGEPVPSEYEARGITRNGDVIWIKRRNCRIHYRGRPAVLGNVVDITERKRMEKDLKQSTESLRFLSSQLLTAQERERKRIAIELHDELGQAMTVLKLQLRAVERKLPDAQAPLKEDCENILHYADTIIENVRRLSHDLSPPILEDLGLSAALYYLVDDSTRHYEIGTDSNMDDIDGLFSHEAEITIYRIFQEILANVGKHANATRLTLRVKKESGQVAFHLEDNGCGFDLGALQKRDPRKGLGLAAMDERVRMLNGDLTIEARPGSGTRTTFVIPTTKG